MKRPITSALLAAALSLSLVVPAGAVSSSTAVEAIQALGIITGDSHRLSGAGCGAEL